MRDATGEVQSALVLGGNSDIATAVVDELADRRLRRVVLAVRDTDQAEAHCRAWRDRGVTCEVLPYEATAPGAHAEVLRAAGDVDVVIVAFGELGDPFRLDGDPEATAALAEVGFTAAVVASQAAADHLRQQGHGSLVVLTSVAGIRVRPENAVYGAAKAGLDGFTRALADSLHGSGVHVMIVRPGFVHTKMTADRPEAPFATTPEAVAADIVEGLRRRRSVVWSPAVLRTVFAGLRALPGPVWRRVAR